MQASNRAEKSDKLVDYTKLESERAQETYNEFLRQLQSKNLGKENSLQHVILKLVVEGHYDEGKKELESYTEMQSDFPMFGFRANRQLSHCRDLITAIRSKRNFPGLTGLPKSKQQEIFEKVLEHFDELKQYLRQIEGLARDVRMSDLRSTTLFIRSLFFAIAGIALAAFLVEFWPGTSESVMIVLDDSLSNFVTWIFSFGSK